MAALVFIKNYPVEPAAEPAAVTIESAVTPVPTRRSFPIINPTNQVFALLSRAAGLRMMRGIVLPTQLFPT